MSASTAPEAPTGDADSLKSKSSQFIKNCWSCRLLSGGGLILSGAYVFYAARKVMRRGGLMTLGLVAQITFAGGLTAWGIVILVDPVKTRQEAVKRV